MKKVFTSLLIGVTGLLFFTACNPTIEAGGGNQQENNQTESQYNQPEGPVLSSAELSDYLASLEDNTVDTPYDIVISDADLETIDEALRLNSSKYVSLWFDESVTKLERRLFGSGSIGGWSQNLVSISVSKNVNYIDTILFSCSYLMFINVHRENSTYKSVNGVLFSKNGEKLLVYPSGRKSSIYNVPEGTKIIDKNAFYHSRIIENISLPNSIITLEEDSFSSCENLDTIKFSSSLKSIGYCAFEGCKNLKSIIIPENVTSIGALAFIGCSQLESIVISESVNSIGNCAFENCVSLSSITIPKNVSTIGERICDGCKNLVSINVNASNNNYKSIDGVLFTKNGEEILVYPQGISESSYSIPSGVKSVGCCAFKNCTKLESITLPSSLTQIKNSSFSNCKNLTSINIPNEVTIIDRWAFSNCENLLSANIPAKVMSIEEFAFSRCTNLATINYRGTEEQWNAIQKSETWNYGIESTNMTINYNYTGN